MTKKINPDKVRARALGRGPRAYENAYCGQQIGGGDRRSEVTIIGTVVLNHTKIAMLYFFIFIWESLIAILYRSSSKVISPS